MEDPGIWNDAERAQALGKEKKSLEAVVLTLSGVRNALADARDFFAMAKEEDDEDTMASVEADLAAWFPKVRPGGVLCGDDFDWPGVSEVVIDFMTRRGKTLVGYRGNRTERMEKWSVRV